jgi:hypothetical protein
MSFPKDLNFSSNKPMAVSGKPSINRYRSDNSTYSGGDTIRIEIPCGRNGQYLFPTDSFIEFKVKMNYTTAAATSTSFYLDGNIYSLFSRMRLIHSSTVVEDTLYCNKLWNALYDFNSSEVERRSDCITKGVFDTTASANQVYNNGNGGFKMAGPITAAATADSSVLDCCFVLPSALLGSLAQKALPLGLMGASSLYLEIELAGTCLPFIASISNGSINSYTMSDIYYNAKISTLPSDIDRALIESTGGIIDLPAVSYKTEMKTIAATTTAWNDKFSFQYSSIKNFLFWVQNGTTATDNSNGANKGGCLRSSTSRPRANISEYFLTINGEAFPTQSIQSTSRMFSELLRSYDSLTDSNAGGILTYQNYTQNLATVADDILAANTPDTVQKRFIAGIDLDKFNQASNVLMCGTSTIGQSVNLQLNMGTNAESLVLYAAVMYDVLYKIQDGLLVATY